MIKWLMLNLDQEDMGSNPCPDIKLPGTQNIGRKSHIFTSNNSLPCPSHSTGKMYTERGHSFGNGVKQPRFTLGR